jgi:hypothetical protein
MLSKLLGLDHVLEFSKALLNKVFADKTTIWLGENELDKLDKSGELLKLASKYKVAIAEASSKDKWTSRGRPAIIYVTLLFIMLSVPFGVLNAASHEVALRVADGMKLWFGIIPPILYECIGAIIIIYNICRTSEKKAGVAQ